MSSNPSLEKFKEFAPKGKQSSQRNTREAVILTRVSSRDQMINGASLSTQQKYCEEFAERQGLLVTASFGGTYESAKSDERKEFQRMLQFVKRKKRYPISLSTLMIGFLAQEQMEPTSVRT